MVIAILGLLLGLLLELLLRISAGGSIIVCTCTALSTLATVLLWLPLLRLGGTVELSFELVEELRHEACVMNCALCRWG